MFGNCFLGQSIALRGVGRNFGSTVGGFLLARPGRLPGRLRWAGSDPVVAEVRCAFASPRVVRTAHHVVAALPVSPALASTLRVSAAVLRLIL